MKRHLTILSNLTLVLQVFLILFCFANFSNITPYLLFTGKFHPLLLHVPVAALFLVIPFSFFVNNHLENESIYHYFDLFLHYVALITTVTAIAGFFIAAAGQYDADDLKWHKWLGVLLAFSLQTLLYAKKLLFSSFKSWNGLVIVLILITLSSSYYGTRLTHGTDFLQYADEKSLPVDNEDGPARGNEKQYVFDALSAASLKELNSPLLRIRPISSNSPALSVKFFLREYFNEDLLKSCLKAKEQVVEMNLAGMPVGDEIFPLLSEFQNLEKLNLNGTDITGKGILQIQNLKNLEQLSITNTKIDWSAVQSIAKIASMKHVFLWNTGIKPQDSVSLKKMSAHIHWEMGYVPDQSERLTLPTPVLVGNEQFIFDKETYVRLKSTMPNAKISYTLDGTTPDSINGNIFSSPILTNRLTRVKAIASLDGWISSNVADFTLYPKSLPCDSAKFLTNKIARGKKFGPVALINGKKGLYHTTDHFYSDWIGIIRDTMKVGFYFNQNQTIREIVLSTAEITIPSANTTAFPPAKVIVKGGSDPGHLSIIGTLSPPVPSGFFPNASIPYSIPVKEGAYAYIEMEVRPHKKLPKRYPEKEQVPWVFVDEVFFY